MPFLDDVPFMLVGAHTAASYASERATQDFAIIVLPADLLRVERFLDRDGWSRELDLAFPSSSLAFRRCAQQNGPAGY